MKCCTGCEVKLTTENWTPSRKKYNDYCCSICRRKSAQKYRKANTPNYLWSAAKHRAKTRGITFNIEPSDIIVPTRCPVLGIKLQINTSARADTSPSLDRIVTSKGYVKGNIEVISWRANRLKSDATCKELRKIADYYNS